MKLEFALARDRLAARGLEIGLDRELAALPGWKIGLEVVNPVFLVSPATAPFQSRRIAFATHAKGFGQPRIAECDHSLGESHGYLPHIFCLALRREYVH